jgi:uncharacterized protein YlaI
LSILCRLCIAERQMVLSILCRLCLAERQMVLSIQEAKDTNQSIRWAKLQGIRTYMCTKCGSRTDTDGDIEENKKEQQLDRTIESLKRHVTTEIIRSIESLRNSFTEELNRLHIRIDMLESNQVSLSNNNNYK